MMLRALLASVFVAGSAFAAAPAQAQEGPSVQALSELAGLLGRAHAIRSLCSGDSDQTWRNYMFNMLAIEAPAGSPNKSALTGAVQSAASATSEPAPANARPTAPAKRPKSPPAAARSPKRSPRATCTNRSRYPENHEINQGFPSRIPPAV